HIVRRSELIFPIPSRPSLLDRPIRVGLHSPIRVGLPILRIRDDGGGDDHHLPIPTAPLPP
ncbi:hypothetical protein PMAYCL1PPCAC_32056, partial [Pristionchus mayeri]